MTDRISFAPEASTQPLNVADTLDAIVESLTAGETVPRDRWFQLHTTYGASGQAATLAQSYDAMMGNKRIKALQGPAQADFFLNAGRVYRDAISDNTKATAAFEKAYVADPQSDETFAELRGMLEISRDMRRLAELLHKSASSRLPDGRVEQLRTAATIYAQLNLRDKALEALTQAVREAPGALEIQVQLEELLRAAGRPRDLCKVLEQAVLEEEVAPEIRRRIRAKLLVLYGQELGEMEKALPHAETLLTEDPERQDARYILEQLLTHRALASRAAAALGDAFERTGNFTDLLRCLMVELEHTRGPKRKDVALRLATLREERLGDVPGALQALEQAIAVDASDEEARRKFVILSSRAGNALDAAKTLSRVMNSAKEARARSRIAADMGELLRLGGDPKRARTTFLGVTSTGGSDPEAVLVASRGLALLYAEDKEAKPLADVLEKVCTISVDQEEIIAASLRLATIVETRLGDVPRAVEAWKRLLPTRVRKEALANLGAIYEKQGDVLGHAQILRERADDACALGDPIEARKLLVEAARLFAQDDADLEATLSTWNAIKETFPYQPDVAEALVPLLKKLQRWEELESVILLDLARGAHPQRLPWLVDLGELRAERLRDITGAIGAYREALEEDREDKTSRIALEKLLAVNEFALEAALALEPSYRAHWTEWQENAAAISATLTGSDTEPAYGLLKVLRVKAELGPPTVKRESLVEGADVSEEAAPEHALWFVERGLSGAIAEGDDAMPWIKRLSRVAERPDQRLLVAGILDRTLGTGTMVDSPLRFELASRAADAYDRGGNTEQAITFFERAFAFAPRDEALFDRLDALLRANGTDAARLRIVDLALAACVDETRMQKLRLHKARIQLLGSDRVEDAISTYRSILGEAPDQRDAHSALVEIFEAKRRYEDLEKEYERRIEFADEVERFELSVKLLRLSLQTRHRATAEAYAAKLLDHGTVDLGLLEQIVAILETLAADNSPLLVRAFQARANAALEDRERIDWLVRLGRQHLAGGNPQAARDTLFAAAQRAKTAFGEDAAEPFLLQVMEVSPLDAESARELSDVYARRGSWGDVASMLEILVETTRSDEARAGHLLQLARVYGDSLGDHPKAVVTAARAFKLTPRDPSTLEELERHAEGLDAMEAFSRAIQEALPSLDGEMQAQARVARARVLSKDALLAGEVIQDLRELLTSLDSYAADNEESILASFDAVLERYPNRRTDKRWLNEWRLERKSEDADKVTLLLAWARDEESLGDRTTARLLHQQTLALDPSNVEALDAVARLCLDSGEVKTALLHLEQLANAVDPENKSEVDLRIARTLFDHANDPAGGLDRLESVLERDPLNAEAHQLLPKAFARHDTAERATALVDQCRAHASSRAESKQLLTHVLGQPGRSSARSRWFVELVNECREEGDLEGAYHWASRAVHEDPRLMAMWDVLEELVGSESVDVNRVSECYADALVGAEPEVAATLGERAVLFLEEWLDDSTTIARVLETILASDMSLSWAFDRLKLLYDREERWADMFSLYDRAIERADRSARIDLLEEISQIAKDFALDATRAISYLERLYELRPESARVFTALERLYERNGRPRELITLLSTRIAHEGTDVEGTRTRIAGLWLDDLGEFSQSLAVIEEVLAVRGGEFPPEGAVIEQMLERILRLAPSNTEVASAVMPSIAPPPSRAKRDSVRPSKRGLVRQRAATILKERFTGGDREEDLVRVLELELETIKGAKERIARHELVATKYEELDMPENALEHRVNLLLLEPESEEHLKNLENVVEKTGRYDRLAEVLTQAGEESEDATLRARVFTRAGRVLSERLNDSDRAIRLLIRVLDDDRVENDGQLAAARAAEPLLRKANRPKDQLSALERMAALETEPETRLTVLGQGGRLAEELNEQDRAIALWRARLETSPTDLEALERLAHLFDAVSAYRDLAQILEELAGVHSGDSRLDYLQRAAKLYASELDLPERAIELWQLAETDFGSGDESTLALVDLYRRVGDKTKLGEALRRAAERSVRADRRAALFRELGDVLLARNEIASAVEAYREALEAEPSDEPSRRGLETCAIDDECAERAIELLLSSFRTTHEWTRLQALLSRRLEISTDDATKVKVLREHAEIAEQRQDDASKAFEHVRDAFLLGPEDATLEEELTRLGDVTQNWSAVSKAYHNALERLETSKSGERAWMSAFTFRVGRYVETRLDDPKHALTHYERVWREDPTHKDTMRALARAGAQVGEWALVFEAFVDKTVREGKIDEEHSGLLESTIHDRTAWDDATRALERATERVSGTTSATVLRDLEHLAARWHKDERKDFDAAERALARALTHMPDDPQLLLAIASLQRRSRGRPLVESLLRLSRATGGDLDLLEEAAETSRAHVNDDALTTSIYEEMLALARDRWLSGGADSPMLGSPRKPEVFVQISFDGLKNIHENHGAWETLAELSLRVSKLPWAKRERQKLVLEAARVRARRLSDASGALSLYGALFDEEPLDEEIAGEFMALLASESRWDELLAALGVRKRLFTDEAALVSTMVEMANIHVRLNHKDAARDALSSGLDRFPANETLLNELGTLLTGAGKQKDFVLTLDAHAKRVSETAPDRARELSMRAGDLAENELNDLELAHALYEQAAKLGAHRTVLRALARVSHSSGQFTKEAEYLDGLRDLSQADERRTVTLEVTEAWIRARRPADARSVLEKELELQPAAEDLRERLADIYRDASAWEALANLQIAWTEWVDNAPRKAQLLYDAGRTFLTELNDGSKAAELLERAAAELPEDENTRTSHAVERPLDRRRVNLSLAEALGTAGRIDEARSLLRSIIDSFGSRKPKDRARVHYTLSKLDLLAGSEDEAAIELETATRIDPSDSDILRALAELRRKRGELEQSERTYRALLAAQRRHDRAQKRGALADVLVELWDIALAMKQEDRAAELFESAMEIAAEGGPEAEAFEAALYRKGAYEHVATMMTRRLKLRADTASAVEWAAYGDLLGTRLGRPADAADAYMRAIDMTREVDVELLGRARVAVKAAGQSERLAKALSEAATRVTTKEARATFRIASAEVFRADVGDANASLGALRDILGDFPGHEQALAQLDETLSALGRNEELAEVIRTRMEADPVRVVELGTRLVRLLSSLGDSAHAARVLGDLAAQTSEPRSLLELAQELSAKFPQSDEVLTTQEELLIAAGDHAATADVVLTRYLLPTGSDDLARRALDLLDDSGDAAAVEGALKRILEKADASKEVRLWALLRLAEIREAASDIRETVLLRREATEIADDDEARELLFNIGTLARAKLKDLPLATEMFEELARRGDLDVRVWEPLLGLYRDLGELDKLVDLITKVQDNVSDPMERAHLRLESARVQATRMGVDETLAVELEEIIETDPTLTDAFGLLLEYYDRANKSEEAIGLLERSLAEVQTRGSQDATERLALQLIDRIGADYERITQILETALGIATESVYLLRRLDRVYTETGQTEASGRADALERLIPIADPQEAATVALELARIRAFNEDADGAIMALELGFGRAPTDARLSTRLEQAFTQNEHFDKLAALYERLSEHATDPDQRASYLMQAVMLVRDQLDDLPRTVELLRRASEARPDAMDPLLTLVDALQRSGESAAVIAEVERGLPFAALSRPRVVLLTARARAKEALGDEDAALVDWEEGLALGSPDDTGFALNDYIDFLAEVGARARSANDVARAIGLYERAAELAEAAGNGERAADFLQGMLELAPDNADLLRRLGDLEERRGSAEGALIAYQTLLSLGGEGATLEAALKVTALAEAAERFDVARETLEWAYQSWPGEVGVRAKLEEVYGKLGAFAELAELYLGDAERETDSNAQFSALLRAGALLVDLGSDLDRAILVLDAARALKPQDCDCAALLSDSYARAGRLQEAHDALQGCIALHKGRRVKDLSPLFHRLARIAEAVQDPEAEISYLTAALDMDPQNGDVAAELALRAIPLQRWDLANRALRTVTMLKTECSMTKAQAYYHQGQVAAAQGDPKKAQMLYKRALDEDQNFAEARAALGLA